MKSVLAGPPRIGRPWVFLNLAMTADGKISYRHDRFEPFGSRHDQESILRLRAAADAVMAGARTIDSAPITLGPGPAKYRRQRTRRGLAEFNLRVVVSGSGTVSPRAEIFRHHFSPIIILTTERAGRRRLRALSALGAELEICGADQLDFPYALRLLRNKWGVKRLLCEGGGTLNAALFQQGLVDEVHLAICPFIFGGQDAPTLADGLGVRRLGNATSLVLDSARRVGQELQLVCRPRRRKRAGPGDESA